ncbi:MAG: hypothetical protein ACRDJ9_25005 [Dehalococcoidia bacterium]
MLELLRALRADIAGLSERTERIELRLGVIESRLSAIEQRLAVVEVSNQRRLERIEKRLELSDE